MSRQVGVGMAQENTQGAQSAIEGTLWNCAMCAITLEKDIRKEIWF